jgi:hypothetical protein
LRGRCVGSQRPPLKFAVDHQNIVPEFKVPAARGTALRSQHKAAA